MTAKKEMTPLESRSVVADSLMAVLSGIRRKKGEITVKPGELRVPTNAIFWATAQLAKDFPSRFPDVYFSNGPGVPVSREIEQSLFRMCAFGLGHVGGDFRSHVFPEASRRAMAKNIEKRSNGEDLDRLIYLSDGFWALVEEFKSKASS